MSDDGMDEDLGDATAPAAPKRWSGKKLILFVVLPVVLLLGGGAAAFFVTMMNTEEDTETAEATGEEAFAEREPGYFYEMPALVVNLNLQGRQQRFLKISVSLELDGEEDVPALQARLPRVTDHFQTYLRNLRVEDLEGSAGVYRLRQELLARVRPAVEPVEVHDVLFQEILIQ